MNSFGQRKLGRFLKFIFIIALGAILAVSCTLKGEIERVRQSVRNTRQNIKRIEKKLANINEKRNIEKNKLESLRIKRNELIKEMEKLQKELYELRLKTDTDNIQEMELQREKLGSKTIELRQNLGILETNQATLESKFDNILKIGADNIRIQLRKIKKQIITVENEVEISVKEKEIL